MFGDLRLLFQRFIWLFNPRYNEQLRHFIIRRKYEALLFGLTQHLFIGLFLSDMEFYTYFVWPFNMFILVLLTVGLFVRRRKWLMRIRNTLFVIVLLLPVLFPFMEEKESFMQVISLVYVGFFLFIFYGVFTFLFRPGYINTDIISASACGYLLIIEICAFLMQYFYYVNPHSLHNVSMVSPALTFIDLVYYASAIQTTIGFGDIVATAHNTKLAAAFFGIVGQFYTVVLVGLMISKFASLRRN